MPKSSLDWLGVVGLWIGAIVLAFKSAGAPLLPGAPVIFAATFWNFMPVVLVSFALLIFIYRQLRPPVPTLPALRALVAPRQAPPIASSQEAAPPQPQGGSAERVFVPDGLTPRKLMAMCEGKTSHQAQVSIKPFIGKWIRVSGIVRDFMMLSEDWGAVFLQSATTAVLGDMALREVNSAKLYFRSDFDRLEMLQGGERFVADGQIKEIDSLSFKADNCEIVSIAPADA
ncbi:MAG: hypothetical protein ABR588_00350 [Sphingomicrobium sp.]|nr:hypothetical protein [Sphingomonadales bacterium]